MSFTFPLLTENMITFVQCTVYLFTNFHSLQVIYPWLLVKIVHCEKSSR